MADKKMSPAQMNHIRATFVDMALQGVNQASQGGSKMGAFILASCFIDCMAGFVCGYQAGEDEYRSFLRQYLPSYNAKKLYQDLRCELVHNYSEGGSYVFVDNKRDEHGKPARKGKTVINLENFIDDVTAAMHKLLRDIESDGPTLKTAAERYEKHGLLHKGKLSEAK